MSHIWWYDLNRSLDIGWQWKVFAVEIKTAHEIGPTFKSYLVPRLSDLNRKDLPLLW